MNVDSICNISQALKREVSSSTVTDNLNLKSGSHASHASQYRKLLKKLHVIDAAVESCSQEISTSLLEAKTDVYKETVKLHADHVTAALQNVRSKVYTTVLVVGQSGSGKTYILNQILNGGLNLSVGKFVLTPPQIQNSLFVTVNKSCRPYRQWSPITSVMDSVVCKNASDYYQFCPSIPTTDEVKQIDILPEGDMLCTTKVPIHIFYGSQVKVTFSYAGAEEVSMELKRLLKAMQIMSSQKSEEHLNMKGLKSEGQDPDTSPLYMEDGHLFKALSILGLPCTSNVANLHASDVKVPHDVAERLGHTFTCQLRETTVEQQLFHVKYLLRDVLSTSSSRWGILDFIAIELPCENLDENVELVDTPSFTEHTFEISRHLNCVVHRTKRLIHVCDERKLDGDFSRFLKKYFIEKLCWPGKHRFAIICNKRNVEHRHNFSAEILSEARIEELANLTQSIKFVDSEEMKNSIRLNCMVFVTYPHSLYQVHSNQVYNRCLKFANQMPDVTRCELESDILKVQNLERIVFDYSKNVCRHLKYSYFGSSNGAQKEIDVQNTDELLIMKEKERLYGDLQCSLQTLTQDMLFAHQVWKLYCKDGCREDLDPKRHTDLTQSQTFSSFDRTRHAIYYAVNAVLSNLVFRVIGGIGQEKQTALKDTICTAFDKFQKEILKKVTDVSVTQIGQMLVVEMIKCISDFERHTLESVISVSNEIIQKFCDSINHERMTNLSSTTSSVVTTDVVNFQELLHDEFLNVIKSKDYELRFNLVANLQTILRAYESRFFYTKYIPPIVVDEFYISCIWNFHTYSMSSQGFDVLHIARETRRDFIIELLFRLCALSLSRGLHPYICTSLSLSDIRFLARELYSKDRQHILFTEIFSIILSMRRIIGGSHRDFCFALDIFTRSNTQTLLSSVEIGRYDEKVHGKLLKHIVNCTRMIEVTKLPRLRLLEEITIKTTLALEREARDQEEITRLIVPTQEALKQVRLAIIRLIHNWGCSYIGFCLADIHYAPIPALPRLTTRNIIVYMALEYLEQEALSCEPFFREWGSDILVSFYFFALSSKGRIQEYCFQASQRVANQWLKVHADNEITFQSREDILFYNEALYALQRLNMHRPNLENHVLCVAPNWSIHEYVGNERIGNFDNTSYDTLNSLMIWSFFFRGTGAQVRGTSKEDVDAACAVAVEALENMTERDSVKTFQEKCYFVTHRIFTETSWCTAQRTQEEFHTEQRFLCYYLPLIQSAADIDLVGECIQTLKYLGHHEGEVLIQNAVNFLLENRDEKTGCWAVGNHSFAQTYHASICAIGAIIDA